MADYEKMNKMLDKAFTIVSILNLLFLAVMAYEVFTKNSEFQKNCIEPYNKIILKCIDENNNQVRNISRNDSIKLNFSYGVE